MALGRLSLNIAANALGKVWIGALQFLFVPVYLAMLGAPAFGLLGFYTTLSISLTFLDQAITPVFVREVARQRGAGAAPEAIRDLLHTLALISIGLGILIGGGFALAAPLVARDWLHPAGLPEAEVIAALRMMGLALACQWPSNLYAGGFIGLHRQGLLTIVRVLISTAQWGGGALAMWLAGPSILVALEWHAASLGTLTLVLAVALWRSMPGATKPARFSTARLSEVWRFSLGTLAIGLTTSLLSQADKLMVARHAPLDALAAYSLAFNAASVVIVALVIPISTALTPHFAGLFAEPDERRRASEYHRWAQLMALATLPPCAALVFFPTPLLSLWLGATSPVLPQVATLLPIIAGGIALASIMTIPSVVQVAAGWTSLIAGFNAVAVILAFPILVVALEGWGPVGAAWYWFALNACYILIMVPLMHRRLLRAELFAWLLRDTILPVAIVAAIFAASAAVAPGGAAPLRVAAQATLTGLVALFVLIAALPGARRTLAGAIG